LSWLTPNLSLLIRLSDNNSSNNNNNNNHHHPSNTTADCHYP
jgi:hypothetical protein